MKKLMFATVALVAAAGAASAADMPAPVYKAPPPVVVPFYNWTGFYVGAHLGYGWDTEHASVAGMSGMGGMGTAMVGMGIPSYDANGVLGGLQAGYNYQMSSWVFGLEGEVAWTNMSGASNWVMNGNSGTLSTDVRWLDTVAGRVGYAFDRTLVYAKGGAAWESADYGHIMTGGMNHSLSGDATRTGWLVGVGIEHAFWQNLSVKLEYNYIDFGSANITTADGAGTSATFNIHQRVNILKAGFNYRFGGEGPVLAKY
jgi:outer membrane immunogenic protein